MFPQHRPVSLSLQFGIVLACSLLGCLLASAIHAATRMPGLDLRSLSLGNSKTNIMFAFFTGLPVERSWVLWRLRA
jgi:hypothetical protein